MEKSSLGKKFEEAMFNIYRTAAKDCQYRPTYFLQMLTERGGVETALQLIRSEKISDGFATLWEKERLDLTVEALVQKEEWRSLFQDEDIGRAKSRLQKHGYRFDSE